MRRYALGLFVIVAVWMAGDPPMSAQQTSGDPSPVNPRQTAARAECKECEPLADRLRQVTEAENRLRAQQEETAAQYRAMLRAQKSDEVMLDHFHEMMHEYNMSAPLSEDRGINAQRKQARTRIAILEAQIAGTVPIFSSSISGDLTLQVDDSCAGALTMRYPNTWTFVHRVTAAPAGSNWQVRSSVPFMSTQPFGLPFSSTIDLTVSGNSFAGLETHAGSGCTDIYVLQSSR